MKTVAYISFICSSILFLSAYCLHGVHIISSDGFFLLEAAAKVAIFYFAWLTIQNKYASFAAGFMFIAACHNFYQEITISNTELEPFEVYLPFLHLVMVASHYNFISKKWRE